MLWPWAVLLLWSVRSDAQGIQNPRQLLDQDEAMLELQGSEHVRLGQGTCVLRLAMFHDVPLF